MVRKFVLLLAIAGAVVAGVAGSATALPGGTTHVVSSNNWRGLTFILGLGSCDLFRAADPSFLGFRDVNLTDELNVTFEGGSLFVYNSTATLHGVINTADDRYTVAGHFVEENNERSPENAFIATSGYATISGPNGVVSGAARFQDLGGPPEFDLIFTSLTVCNLK
jgi:hypothetical protein